MRGFVGERLFGIGSVGFDLAINFNAGAERR
jgi:hypothetical protein